MPAYLSEDLPIPVDRNLEAHFLIGYLSALLDEGKQNVIAFAHPIRFDGCDDPLVRALAHVRTTLGHEFEIEVRSLEVSDEERDAVAIHGREDARAARRRRDARVRGQVRGLTRLLPRAP
jgi:hypothetical protein